MNFSKYLGKTGPTPVDLQVDRAEGVYFYDKSGKRYTDLISGIGVSYVGHGHPRVKEAVKRQVDHYMHVMVYGEFDYDIQRRYAERVIYLLGHPFEQIFFTNSGTEANEGALKLAKRATGRTKIISFERSYHGSTHGSLSVSGNESRKRNFRPLLPAIHFLPFGEILPLDQIDSETAAVIIEPVQGDAGVRIPSVEFMQRLRKKCDETGAVLIFDEIQTGFGRTGKWFCHQHFGICPDIVTMGKSLGGGLPLGGFAASRKLMEQLTFDPPLGHITTFGGNPVCCAAGLESTLIVEDEGLLKHVEAKGKLFEDILGIHKKIKSVRRMGLLMAFELASEAENEKMVLGSISEGQLIYWFLSTKNSFRLAPPLIITEEQIVESCSVLSKVLDRI